MTDSRRLWHDRSLTSRALNRSMSVRIITPPGYAPQTRSRYPVLYFLHPWGLSPQYLTERLNMPMHVQAGILNGSLPPFLIVLPTGDRSFFVNAADPPGHDWAPILNTNQRFFENALEQYGRYGDYLMAEVIPFVEAHYPVRTDRAGRAIGGISMGGAGAAIHAFRKPDNFSAVGIHSPALFAGPPEHGGIPWIFGIDRADFAARNPADMAQTLASHSGLRIYLDTGDADPMVRETEHLHDVLQARAIPHHYHLRPGVHNRTYWEPHMPEYLAFYAAGWH